MDDSLQNDLLIAHADALRDGTIANFRQRYSDLFPDEMARLTPLFTTAEQLYPLLAHPAPIRSTFRATLKADLVAQAHQEGSRVPLPRWRWAALGVGVMLAAAAWRGRHPS